MLSTASSSLGMTEAIAFLNGSMKSPPNYIRINTLAATEDATLQKLKAEGVELEKTDTPQLYLQSLIIQKTSKRLTKLRRRLILRSRQS